MKKLAPIIFFSFCAILIILPQTVRAESFESRDYSIDGEILPGGITPTPQISQADQNSSGKRPNYVAQSGYEGKTSSFSLEISQDMVDYGPLTPTDPITRTTTISIHSDYGYSLFISEDHPLRAGKNLIPDTTCDNGSCSEDIPAPWASALTYGLGYRCDDEIGSGCETPFQNAADFLQLPKKPWEAMKNIIGGFSQSKMTFRLNISGIQPSSSTYTNQVMYIALPAL